MSAYPVAGPHCTLGCGEALVWTVEMVNDRAPGTNELATSARAVMNPFAMLTVYESRLARDEGKRTVNESFKRE